MPGDNVMGLLRAEKFPEGHPLQPGHRWIARVPWAAWLRFMASSLRPEDRGEPPWEPACCGWEMPGIPAGPQGCAPLGGPPFISFHANKKEIFAAIIK